MARRLIGTGTTGTDGSVTIPYTGTGAGLVQMDVETEIDGSIVSGTLPVLDGVLFDTMTASDSTKWQDYGVTATYGTDGTNLKNGTDYRYQVKYDLANNLAVEFDVNPASTSTDNLRLYLRGQLIQLYPADFPKGEWNKIGIKFYSNKLEIYKNGTFLYDITNSNWNAILQLRVGEGIEANVKNFVIYPF